MIGIKVANGEFYPILEEKSAIKKHLILTTAHDNQKSVQIDLYNSATNSMTEARYVGTIVVDNLTEKKQGDPSIKLIIASDAEGRVNAEAFDVENSNPDDRHKLSVSLETLEDKINDFDYPDFEGEDNALPDVVVANAVAPPDIKKPLNKVLIVIAGVVALCAIILALWFFVFKGKIGPKDLHDMHPPTVSEENGEMPPMPDMPQTETMRIAEAEQANLAEEAALERAVAERAAQEAAQAQAVAAAEAERQAAAQRTAQTAAQAAAAPKKPALITVKPPAEDGGHVGARRAPVMQVDAPRPIPSDGASYKVRWGDTLWDVSSVYYQNPWYYKYLARYNDIKNPNQIIAGRTLKIPPTPEN
jgi:LysM repeat protein